jgi:hypothetical protein
MQKGVLSSHCYSADIYFREITPFTIQSDTPGHLDQFSVGPQIQNDPVIYSMSLATPRVSDAHGNSKGVMSEDLEVSLHCHCNSRTVPGRDIFLRRGNSQKIELGFRIERERGETDLYRLLLNGLSSTSLRVSIPREMPKE